jgi:hypothetical protein
MAGSKTKRFTSWWIGGYNREGGEGETEREREGKRKGDKI